MRETKFNIENTSVREIAVMVHSIEDNVTIKLFHNNELKTDVINKGITTWKIRSNEQVDFIMDTTKSWVVTPNNKFLKEVDGPIHYIEGEDLNSVFKGCYSLTKVSEDVFSRNEDKVAMTRTFKDCMEFVLSGSNAKMFSHLPNIKVLDETFANNDNSVITDNIFIYEYKYLKLKDTFKDNVYLEGITNKPFGNVGCIELISTFENCTSLKGIHSEFFNNIKESSVLNNTFKGSGITKVDPNILTHISSGVVYKDIFLDCDCKINKDFN